MFGEFFTNRPHNGLSFFQPITDTSVETFSHENYALTFVDPRNYSAESNLQFKEHIASYMIKMNQSAIDDDLKTIPVQHAILDMSATNLFYKMR